MVSLSQKQIILGGLLGDSSLNRKNRTITFTHSIKQKEYLEWKNSFFNAQIKDALNKWQDKYYPRKYFYYYFNKGNEALFSFLCRNLYSEKRKKISLKYLYELDSLGLAIWWLDDGNISNGEKTRFGKLSTHCFNYEEHILLQKYFKERWNINVAIKKEKDKYYFLRLNVTELKKLISIIYIHVCEIPSMIYKIDLPYVYRKRIGKDFIDIYDYINSKKLV